MKQRRRRPSVSDLQNLFLVMISKEVPEVVGYLFETGDARKWAEKKGCRADWLNEFAEEVLKQQQVVNWITARLEKTSPARLHAPVSAWEHAAKKRIGLDEAVERVMMQCQVRRFDHEWTSRRNSVQHCRWLVLWLFKKKPDGKRTTDGDIAELEHVANRQTVTEGRREIANLIGLSLRDRRGRPRRKTGRH